MATVQCDNFVGNAWKKDLCLNCFKSKEEHIIKNGHSNAIIPTRILDPPKEGILKGTKSGSQTTKGSKVIFLNTEDEIIGFGGDDVYSDEEDYPDSSCNGQAEDADLEDSEEDKALQRLTKSNTDFNSIPENLQEPKEGEVKKIIEPLKLGKQVFDDKGNKKTLLVSVTPFGDQTSVKNKINVNLVKTNGAVAKEIKVNRASDSEMQKKDVTVPRKIKLGEEKTETIANGDNAKENGNCFNGEIAQKEKIENSVEINGDDTSCKAANDKSLKRSQPLDKNFKFRVNKDLQKENEKNIEMNGKEDNKIKTSDKVNSLIDKAKKKVNQFPVITDNSNFKFKTKDFMSENLKKASGNNKAVVLDMFNIREKEDVKIHNEINGEKAVKKLIALPEMRNHILSSEVKISKSGVEDNNKEKKEKVKHDFHAEQEIKTTGDSSKSPLNKADAPQKNLVFDRNKLVPNVSTLYRHHFKNALTKSDEEEKAKTEIVSSNIKPPVNKVIGFMSLVPNIECSFTEVARTIEDKVSESKEGCLDLKDEAVTNEIEIISQKDGITEDDKFKKSSFNSLENFKNIIKGEEITLFSAENEVGDANYDKEKQTDREKDGVPEISRESAGEPDGRADSDDLSEPPALPLKPPPPLTESRTTFLQDLPVVEEGMKMGISDKPKVPIKPLKIQSKKTNFQSPLHTNRPKSPSMEKFLDSTSSPQLKAHLPLQESLSTDSISSQKRQAPKPPSPKEDTSKNFVAVLSDEKPFDLNLNHSETENSDILRISRSTENLLEIITGQDEKDKLAAEGLEEITVPEPVPRKNLSRSQDSLMLPVETEESQTKKKPSRGRFFLRKLLHLGKSKEISSKDLSFSSSRSSLPPAHKPKLEIIHPSDLNGTRVEVVPPARTSKSRRTSSSASSSSGEQRESDVLSDSSTSHSMSSSGNDSQNTIDRNKKPPPPPRAHSVEAWNAKPARPPPPKSIDILRQANTSWCTTVETKTDNLYVNLGEARIGLAPHKPMRTGSLREVNMDTSKRLVTVSTQPEDSDYESFIVSSAQCLSPSPQLEDNLYECVQASNFRSSLPECDSSMTDCNNSEYAKGKQSSTCRNSSHRRSEGNVDLNSDSFKMKFLRSVSLYCASETESEIYPPYSFYGSELGEDDYDSSSATHSLRMSRLKLKKGRSIVHKSLEDNYGAVIVANHEALAQVVEQMRQGPSTPPALRGLSTSANLRWTDFVIAKDEPGVVVERRVFYPATWGTHNVTLSVMAEQSLNSSLHAKGPFNLNTITELNDLIPASYLPMLKKNNSELIQASVSILTRLQIETIETYGINKNIGILSEESKKEVNFVLLQIINAFKSLQAQGIEEAPKNLTNLVVCREEKDPHPRICIIHSIERSENETSLCQCLIHAIKDLLPRTDLTPLISNVLLKEKAVSLSQAKAILEFSLWGPSDIAFGNSNRERESALQRWLDLERATVLHGLVRTRAELTVFEQWQLLFLVRTSSKILAEASLVLEDGNTENISTA